MLARTRIRLPECAGPRLPRPALHERLLAGPRVVVVQAPGGYGKSSLLVDALRAERPAWYSLRPDEADAPAFLASLLQAVQVTHPQVVERALGLLGAPPVTALNAFLNDLLAADETVHLVLDDLHRMAGEEEVRSLLQRLVEHAPPQLRLYLLTREPLDLPTARLEVAGSLLLLRGEDLAFRPAEVEALFTEVWGLPVDGATVARLLELSGGWVTALVLVRLAARGQDLQEVLASFETGPRTVFGYLGEEILRREPAEVQRFLLETAILHGFDAETAAAVSGQPDAVRLLADLDRRGLFLVRAEGGGHRYHHLFEAFLREMLKREVGLEGWRARHARAAEWFAERDEALALEHALEAGDFERAAVLLERAGNDWIARGATRRVGAWLDALPGPVRQAHPRLRVLQANVDDMRGEWVRAMQGYQDAIRELRHDRAGLADALQRAAYCLARYGSWKDMGGFVRLAARHCPEDDLDLRARILSWSGAQLLATGRDFERGYRRIAAARRLARRSGHPEALAIAGYSYAFFTHLALGRFERGQHRLQECSHLMERLQNRFASLQMRMQQVVLLWLQGDLEEAWQRNRQLEGSMSDFEKSFCAHAISLNRAAIALDAGRREECEEALARIEADGIPVQIRPWYLRTVLLHQLRWGRPERALEVVEVMLAALREVGSRGLYAPECLLAAAAAHEAAGDRSGALRLARRALAIAESGRMAFWEMKAHAWLARLDGSDEHLSAALRGAGQGYERWWLNDSDGIAAPLLQRALACGVEAATAAGLRRRQDPTPSRAARVEITTLGGFSVRVEGRDADATSWRRTRMVALLKLMLSRPRLALTIEEAGDRLWPEAPPERARHNVRVHVALLRKALQPGREAGLASCVVFERDAYRLVPGDDLGVDRLRFEDLVREGERLARAGRTAEAVAALGEAAGLYAGDFLAGEPGEDWLEARREALRETCRRCLLRLAELDPRGAAGWLRRLQEADPCDEEVARRLMLVADTDEGRRAWRRLVEALGRELETEPTAETRAVAERRGLTS